MNRDQAAVAASGAAFANGSNDGADVAVRTPLSFAEFVLFRECGQARQLAAGEALFRRGDLGTTMYVIEQGAVELDFGEDLATKHMGPLEFFGELGLLIGNHARTADAVASADTTLYALDHGEFQHLVDRDPGLVAYFLRRAIGRVVFSEQSLLRQLRRRNQDLEAALDNLHAATHQLSQTSELIRVDELTGLYNRRGLHLHLQERRTQGMPARLGLILIDCDRFKRVNDEYGHIVGDRVLQGIAAVLRSVIRHEDVACRLGGDEFCLLVQAGSLLDVQTVAMRVLDATRAQLSMPQHPPRICPISVGACLVDGRHDWGDWYAQADEALYLAKRQGGNRAHWNEVAASART